MVHRALKWQDRPPRTHETAPRMKIGTDATPPYQIYMGIAQRF